MGYTSDTTARKDHRLRLVVLIAGIERVFVEDAVSPTSLVSDRTQHQGLIRESISIGEERIDMVSRAVTGGGLTFRVRETDPTAYDLLTLFGYRAETPRTNLVTTSYARGGSETTITVDDTTGFAASGTIHIGAEAISYTGTTATTFTGASRAAYSTKKGDHRKGVSGEYLGAMVTQYPQSWRGRRVTLKAGYLEEDGTMDDLVTIGTFRMEEPPAAVDDGNTYEIRCGPLSQVYREARCYVGVREATLQDYDAGIGGETFETYEFNDQNPFISGSSVNAHALIESDQGTYRLSQVESVSGTGITVGDYDYLTPQATELTTNDALTLGKKIRHVAMLSGSPVNVTLQLLTSIEGDATNGNWDALPGVTTTDYGAHQWRFGAALDHTEINKVDPASAAAPGSILHFENAPITWRHLLWETLDVSEVLREFCQSVGAFWYINSSGLLSFERLRDSAPASEASQSLTLDDSVVIDASPPVRVSEENIAHTMRLRTNWEPLAGRHLVDIRVTDWEIKDRYPESAQELTAESKFVSLDIAGYNIGSVETQRISGGSGVSVEEYAARLRRAQNLTSLGEVFVDLTCSWAASVLTPGQIADVSLSRTPNTQGGRLTSARGFVVSRRLNPSQGTVNLTVRIMPNGRIFAPVGVISSVSTTTNTNDTFTLNTTDDTVDPALSSPADAFLAGWQVYCYDRSALTLQGPFTISSVSTGSHQVVLTADPGFVPVAGDYIFPVVNQAASDAGSGYDENDFGWFTDESGDNEGSKLS